MSSGIRVSCGNKVREGGSKQFRKPGHGVGLCLSGDMPNKNTWLSREVESNFGGLSHLALSGSRLIAFSAEAI